MEHIPTLTTYLEMFEPPTVRLEAPRSEVEIHAMPRTSSHAYRFLYNSVGKDYLWVDRNRMSDEELQRLLDNDAVELYQLNVEERPAGFAELDCRQPGEIELAYFGLFPEAIGQGLGKYFLNWILHRAWSHAPRRVWVHTCDLDHPAALPNYLRAGLQVYDRKMIQQPTS